jgi:hypothetical protein
MISAKVEQGLKTINEEAKKKGSQLNAKKKTGF